MKKMSDNIELNNATDIYSINSLEDNNNGFEGMRAKNNRLINIGYCTKFYFYILGSALFKFFFVMILGSQENTTALFSFSPISTIFLFMLLNASSSGTVPSLNKKLSFPSGCISR